MVYQGDEWGWSGDCGLCLVLREGLIAERLGVRQDGKTPMDLAIEEGEDATAALLAAV